MSSTYIPKLQDDSYIHKYTNPTLLQPPTTYTKTSIPQIIWQTAKSHNTPPRVSQQIIQSWHKISPEYKRRLLDDDELHIFMSSHFNQTVVQSFLDLPLPVMRADFFRLAVMYYNGGIYADVDVELKQPIQNWSEGAIDKCDVVIGMENDMHICNWGFASRPHHLLFRIAMDLSMERFVHQNVSILKDANVHFVTGPGLLTDAVHELAKRARCEGVLKRKEDYLFAHVIYDSCRSVLKETYNVCLYDKKTQQGWFRNHYASQKKVLQSDQFVSSWTDQINEKKGENETSTLVTKLGRILEYIRYQLGIY